MKEKIEKELSKFKPMTRGRFKEKDLEKQLLIWLQRPFDDINYQVPCKRGKVDIVVGKKYAIELKLASSPSQLHNFPGQVFAYSKEFEKVFLVIYDTKGAIKQANIKELTSDFANMGAPNIKVIKKH